MARRVDRREFKTVGRYGFQIKHKKSVALRDYRNRIAVGGRYNESKDPVGQVVIPIRRLKEPVSVHTFDLSPICKRKLGLAVRCQNEIGNQRAVLQDHSWGVRLADCDLSISNSCPKSAQQLNYRSAFHRFRIAERPIPERDRPSCLIAEVTGRNSDVVHVSADTRLAIANLRHKHQVEQHL